MIELQFAAGTEFFSKAIQWYSHGGWSHVDAVLPDGSLLGSRLDGGVQIRPSGYLGKDAVLRVTLPCSGDMETKFYEFLNSELGKPYDKTAIIAFVMARDWREPDSFYCSELIALGLEKCGYFRWPLSVSANKITPSDLLMALSVTTPITC